MQLAENFWQKQQCGSCFLKGCLETVWVLRATSRQACCCVRVNMGLYPTHGGFRLCCVWPGIMNLACLEEKERDARP